MLDNLEEGVIILEEKSNNVLYSNAAANGVHVRKKSAINSDLADKVKTELKAMVYEIDEERFAKIDKSLLETTTNIDTGMIMNALQNTNEFISLQEIITQATRDNVWHD